MASGYRGQEIQKAIDGIHMSSLGVSLANGALGTPDNPVNSFADALTLAVRRKTRTLIFANPADSWTAPSAINGYHIIGSGTISYVISSLNPNNQDFTNTVIENCAVHTGAMTTGGKVVLINCECDIDATGNIFMYNCRLFDHYQVSGTLYAYNCFADPNTILIIYTGAGADFELVGFTGFVQLTNHVAGCYGRIMSSSGAIVDLLDSCTGGSLELYGDITLHDLSRGTQIYDFTLNEKLNSQSILIPSLVEYWQDESGIPAAKWTVTDPATGTAWARGADGGDLMASAIPNANETARLISTIRLPMPSSVASGILRKLTVEFMMQLANVANMDNTLCFFGLVPDVAAVRTTQNIIGFALNADALQTVTDSGGAETVNAPAATLTNKNKFRIEFRPGSSRSSFFLNGTLVATHTNTPIVPQYINWFVDTEAGGAATVKVGAVRAWVNDFQWF